MDVLITGGAGFIGSRTAVKLVEAGHRVLIVDTLSEQIHGRDAERSPTYSEARSVAEVVRGDVRDGALMKELVGRSNAVLHLAAETGTGQSMYDIVRYSDVNVTGTATLLEAVAAHAGRIERLVVASSRSVYGEGSYCCATHGRIHPRERDTGRLKAGAFDPLCPDCSNCLEVIPTREDAALNPTSIYAATKLAQENMALAFGRTRDLATIALRYQNVYGQGQSLSNPYTGILSIFSREMLSARPIEIFEDGLESRDFVHVDDVAAANVMALTHSLNGSYVLNIGTGMGTSVIDLTRKLGELLAFKGSVSISGRYRAGDIRHNVADIAAAARKLAWAPQKPFAVGLGEFASWVAASLPNVDDGVGYQASLDQLERHGLIAGRADALNPMATAG